MADRRPRRLQWTVDRLTSAVLTALLVSGGLPFAATVSAVEPSPSHTPIASPEGGPEGSATPLPSTAPTSSPPPSPTESPAPTPSTDPLPSASARPLPPEVPTEPIPSGRPVTPFDPQTADEVETLRTETSRTFDLGQGRLVAELATEPIHYRPAPGAPFEPIDLTFRADGEAAVVERSPVTVRVAPASDPGGVLTLTGPDGFRIGYAELDGPATATGRPITTDAVADIGAALAGLDVRVAARADGANLFLIVPELPAEPAWTVRVDVPPGTTLQADEAGGIDVVDATGTTRARIAPPYAVDSTPDPATGGGRVTTALRYRLGETDRGQPTLTVEVTDRAWLAEAIYPVYVDPSTTLVLPGSSSYGDTFINQGNPTQNYANYQRPDSPTFYEMWLGESPSDPSYYNIALLRFDISSLAGRAIDAAEVQLRPYHAYYDAPTERAIWAHRVTDTWTEGGVTWNTAPPWTSTTTTTTCAESTSLSCVLGITYWMRLWLRAGSPHHGVRIDTDDLGPTYWKRLIASEQAHSTSPRLYVEYHDPVTAVAPLGGTKTASRTMSWVFDKVATDSFQGAFQVEVSTSSGFGTILVSSGTVSTADAGWAIPTTTSLTAGSTYHWRVRTRIGADTSWSPWSVGSFVWDPTADLGEAEQHTFESWDLGGGDELAVNAATGNLTVSHPVADLPIRGGTLPITLHYNAFDPTDVGFGPGWRLDLQRRLAINGSTVTYTDESGGRHGFTATGTVGSVTSYAIPATIDAELKRDTSQTGAEFTLTYRDRSVDVFKTVGSQGLLRFIRDRMGRVNQVTVDYTGSTADITTVTDPAGRQVAFTWNADTVHHVTQIRDWASVSSGVVATSGTANRATRFFYSAGSLTGWAEPPNTTTTSCPSTASYATCLTYANGLLATLKKRHVTAQLAGGVISNAPAADAITTITYRGGEVRAVRDATQSAATETTFARSAPNTMRVVRAGTPATTTDYGLASGVTTYGRVGSVTRWLGSTPIVATTAWHATYPTKVASLTEDDGGSLERTTTNTWAAGAIGPNLTRTVEPLNGTEARWTDHTYNSRQDVTQTIVSRNGSTTDRTTARQCYGPACGTGDTTSLVLLRTIDNLVDGTKGGANGHVEDVTTEYAYGLVGGIAGTGLRTSEIRQLCVAGGSTCTPLTTGFEYDLAGNLTKEIANHVDGAVSTSTPADIDPDPATNARTDLTSVHTYDTAGNRVSTADPRRAIRTATGPAPAVDDYVTRWTYDALDRQVTEKTPTTPGITITQKTSSTTYDEFGGVRSTTDFGGLVTATKADLSGRALETYEDTDGAGVAVAVHTGLFSRDAVGRVTGSRDQRQVAAPAAYGETRTEYDALGRATTVTEAWAIPALPDESTTLTTYDALDRITCVQVGWVGGTCADPAGDGQSTVTTHDLGGRVISVDDEFTCTTTSFDYRDLATSTVEGKTPGSPCTGSGTRTIVQTFDDMGRMTSRAVSGGYVLEASTFDSLGRATKTWSTEAGGVTRAVETDHNDLDEPIKEWRYTDTSGTKSAQTWARSNHDAAGNETDRCTWTSDPVDPDPVWCVRADLAPGLSPAPTTAASSTFDARNNRVAQYTPGLGTTLYDPAADYKVSAILVPTAAGRERQTQFQYDGRHRLWKISEVLCATSGAICAGGDVLTTRLVDEYGYDGNDSRILVKEDNGAGQLTRHYCHDARDQVINVSTGSATCATGIIETYGYDDSGNRTAAPGRTYTYDDEGQLASCSGSPACNPTHDADGRLTRITTAANGTWTYLYDAEGRLVSACQSTACTGSGFARMDLVYDGEGHRTRLVERTSGGTVTTTDFTYAGDAVVREVSTTGATTITRAFTTDDAGAIIKVAISGDPVTLHNGTYLVTWNGHGDAIALSKVDTSGALTVANRYRYSTWGTPEPTTTLNGYGDLRFRYLYVGQYGVTWDGSSAIPSGLHYMRARHYSPEFGRFLQPDPAKAEHSAFAYAVNQPETFIDPDGHAAVVIVIPVAWCLAHFPLCASLVASGAYAVGNVARWVVTQRPQLPRVCIWGCNSSQRRAARNETPADRWYLAKKAKSTGKSKSTDIPSWARGKLPRAGETSTQAAERILKEKYGPVTIRKGPGSEFNKLKKFFDRRGRNR